MGGLMEYDDTDPLSLERYMQMKVLVDVRKPLRRGLKIATRVNVTKWVDIKYERLGDFCYFCGRLGHIDRDCGFYNGEENNGKDTVYRYGPWLRASPLKRSRNFGVDNEKEKRVLNKLTNMKVQSTSRYEDPNVIKLGPPSMAHKALFQDATDHACDSSSGNDHYSPNKEQGVNNKEAEDIEETSLLVNGDRTFIPENNNMGEGGANNFGTVKKQKWKKI
ncbi:Cellular nucleic acid-binding protein-like protein [Bienertia sinuspersici]